MRPGWRADLEVLILAAGSGRRLGLGPKAFVRLGERTLLEHAAAAASGLGARLLIAVPRSGLAAARAVAPPGAELLEGGDSRRESLRRLLDRARAELVVIHDVAHPLAGADLFPAVVAAARAVGCALAVLRPSDFVYRDLAVDEADSWTLSEAARVESAWVAQSPKAFRRELLARAVAAADGGFGGDDIGVIDLVRRVGGRVATVPGEARNIKVTTPEDLRMAERLLGD